MRSPKRSPTKKAREGRVTDPDHIPLLGLRVNRKTDIVALVALILSIGSIAVQIHAYLVGPSVHLFAPAQFTIVEDQCAPQYGVRLVASMGYVNSARPGHNAVVTKQFIAMTVGEDVYRFIAHKNVFVRDKRPRQFDEAGCKGVEGIVSNSGTIVAEEDAAPFTVDAGSSASNEVLFIFDLTPSDAADMNCPELKNCISMKDLIAKIDQFRKAGGKWIQVELTGRVLGEDPAVATCRIDASQALVDNMQRNHSITPPCYEYDT